MTAFRNETLMCDGTKGVMQFVNCRVKPQRCSVFFERLE